MTLEKLLNTLCEKGWNPFYGEIKNKWGVRGNYPCKGVIKIRKNTIFISYRYESGNERITKRKKVQHSIRELTSISSGLWLFCVENGLVREDRFTWMVSPDPFGEDQYDYTDYRYRIIESALCDESELEEFLLNSIIIND